MNAARRAARAGRNLLIALLLGAVVVIVIVIAYVAGRGTYMPNAAPSAPQSAGTMTPSTHTETDAAPSGCLGGTGRDNAMLLTAQANAPHTTFGAVDFSAALLRWAYRYPYPTTAQADEIGTKVVASSATAGFKDIAASYSAQSDITGGQIPAKTPFYLSTTSGVWRVDSGSTADRVTVDLNAAYVVNGAVSATKSAAISATVVWTGGAWHLLSEQKPDTGALTSGGTAFSAGC